MNMLGADGEPAEPTPEVMRAIDRAIDQVREGAARVVVKGQTDESEDPAGPIQRTHFSDPRLSRVVAK